MVDTAAAEGSSSNWTAENTRSGTVVVLGPATNAETATSPSESTPAKTAPATIPGLSCGRVTVKNTRVGDAPRLWPARSRV